MKMGKVKISRPGCGMWVARAYAGNVVHVAFGKTPLAALVLVIGAAS